MIRLGVHLRGAQAPTGGSHVPRRVYASTLSVQSNCCRFQLGWTAGNVVYYGCKASRSLTLLAFTPTFRHVILSEARDEHNEVHTDPYGDRLLYALRRAHSGRSFAPFITRTSCLTVLRMT
jgi:hypothetical protein